MSVQDEVRSLVSRYLRRVSPSGPDNIMAVCPFHIKADGTEERHPSFAMSLTKGVYYCHSCHTKGNLYTFLKEMGVDGRAIHAQYKNLLDALAHAAPKAKFDPLRPKLFADPPMPESVLGLFDYCPLPLVDPNYAEPGDPVYDEGLVRSLDLGFDIKHNRITFPLRDSVGRLVGISGRTVVNDWPRYKVYDTEYEAYDMPKRQRTPKGSIVWNYDKVHPLVYYGPYDTPVVVVEGFKACMSVLAAGISTTVALLGSHMTEAQQYLLERLGGTLYLMLDNDEAGQNGLAEMAPKLASTWTTRVVEYEGKQPSDLNSSQIWESLERARNYYIWRAERRR